MIDYCVKCGTPLDDNGENLHHYNRLCRKCQQPEIRTWLTKQPEEHPKITIGRLIYYSKLDQLQRNQLRLKLLKQQHNECYRCHKQFGPPNPKYPNDPPPDSVLDHDHGSDLIRGLACQSCNLSQPLRYI